jgi:hypothetical protein
MSWSDDIRCLYCDGRLPLYRKITHGQFCSSAHRKEYWKEQERLALERLHQTHHSLRAFHSPAADPVVEPLVRRAEPLPAAETQPAPVDQPVPAITGALPPIVEPAVDVAPELIAADPLEYEIETAPRWPVVGAAPQAFGILPMTDLIRWVPDWAPPADCGMIREQELEPLAAELAVVQPCSSSLWESSLPGAIQEAPLGSLAGLEERLPQLDRLFRLSRIPIQGGDIGLAPRVASVHPLRPKRRPRQIDPACEPPAAGESWVGSLLPLEIPEVPLVHGVWESESGALEFRRATGSPQYHLATPGSGCRLPLAGGRRYEVAAQTGSVRRALPPTPISPKLYLTLPVHEAELLPVDVDPPFAPALPLEGWMAGATPSPARPCQIVSIPVPPGVAAVRPRAALEPVAPPPVWLAEQTAAPAEPLPVRPARTRTPIAWTSVAGFWKHAPRDLKILMIAIPLLMALAFQSPLPKVQMSSSPAASGFRQVFSNIRQSVVERAAVALDEDFRAGLDEWGSRSGEPVEWSYDATGFVKPGDLALYAPSVGLDDYEMQFLGMIDRKALSWVVRAADFDNYYVVKLMVTRPGPVPEIGVTRYAVVDGVAQDRADTVVAISARTDTLYRVRMEVHGDDFTLSVQGNLIDSWSDARLRRGGVGFFNARGEESRVRWVQVTHQYDMLGRLCAYLAPYNIPSTNGSFPQ